MLTTTRSMVATVEPSEQSMGFSGRLRRRARTGLLLALAAAATIGANTLPAAATPPEVGEQRAATATSAAAAAYGKVYKNVWHTAPSYYSGLAGRTGGYLYAGRNYFYCQDVGQQHRALGYYNNWWLYTDDDSGHRNVWVSAVYVSGGGNNQPIPGVRRC
jgi:hypothetical protein